MAAIAQLFDESFETTAGAKTARQLIEPPGPTVFIAYPMDFTPVCTAQLCSYRDHWAGFASLPCRWWGINQANAELHQKFKSQKQLPFDLISDPNGKLLKALGLWGILRTRRGFAIVAPNGEITATDTIFPFFYRSHEKVMEFVKANLKTA